MKTLKLGLFLAMLTLQAQSQVVIETIPTELLKSGEIPPFNYIEAIISKEAYQELIKAPNEIQQAYINALQDYNKSIIKLAKCMSAAKASKPIPTLNPHIDLINSLWTLGKYDSAFVARRKAQKD